jgi:hypothetical protein
MSEGASLLTNEKRGEAASPLLRTVAIVVVILSVGTVFFTVAFGAIVLTRVGAVRDAQDQELLVGPATPLPARYHVPYTSMTPAKDQGRRGTCEFALSLAFPARVFGLSF